MRNKLNEVKEFDIISRCDTIRIAMFDEPYPYIVPVNFGEEIIGDQVVFYIHTDYEGKKNDLLAKNLNIAFEMDCNHELYYREKNMVFNDKTPSIDVDPETYEVKVDDTPVTSEPADKLPLTQLYNLF